MKKACRSGPVGEGPFPKRTQLSWGSTPLSLRPTHWMGKCISERRSNINETRKSTDLCGCSVSHRHVQPSADIAEAEPADPGKSYESAARRGIRLCQIHGLCRASAQERSQYSCGPFRRDCKDRAHRTLQR